MLADDGAKVTFSRHGDQVDHHTGKTIPDTLVFDYRDGETRYVLTYSRQKTLVSQKLLDLATGWQKLAAELIRYPGGYLRFSALVSLDCYQADQLSEHYEERGFFKQRYFARHIHAKSADDQPA